MDPLHVVETALTRAKAVLLSHFGRIDHVERKGSDIDLVTVADKESERAILDVLAELAPDVAVLSEETPGSRAPAEGLRFVVDPLDGTTNFSHGFPLFSVTVSLEEDGVPVVGGIDAPVLGERFLAVRGRGATRNGAPLRVSRAERLADALLVTGFPYDRRAHLDRYLHPWKGFLARAQGVLRLGSAALDLASVACGRLDGFWEEKLAPWDTSAGALLVREAGGRVTDFGGADFSPYAPSVLATNGAIHAECLEVLSDLPSRGELS